MAASSKYLQLSSSVLMEYQYADQSDLASHQRITTLAKLWKMHNAYLGIDYIMNDDSSESLTGNVRDRSAVLIDKTLGKYAYLNIDGINVYNDIDDNLTSLGDLPINPVTPDLIVYDKVKLHFTQGFNFEQKEGLIIELSVEQATGTKMVLGSQAFIEEDTYATLNPAPFLFGGKQYTSYIEFEIPSLYNLIEDYRIDYIQGGDGDIGSYAISPNGYNLTTPINVKFGFIDEVKIINGSTFFHSYYQIDTLLSKTDQFSAVTANVTEASDGDYYEVQPLHNGINIENYIDDLNNDGGDYIILHDIAVFEQLPIGGTAFTKTQDLQIAQIDEFDKPIKFRPVIVNGAIAISYRIDYVARLYNRLDNTQIWKVASITNLDTKKYAKVLNKLQIGTNPVIASVYNDVIQKTLNLTNLNSEDVSLTKTSGYTKYVTSFIESSHVHLSNDIVYRKVVDGKTIYVSKENSSSEDLELFGQGELDLSIHHTDAFYKFVIYNDDRNGQKTQMDLNGIGALKLQFFVGEKMHFEITELKDSGANRAKGEAIFKIPASKSKELSNKKDQPLYIVAKPEDGGAETVLYQSIFTGPGAEQSNKKLSKAVVSLKGTIAQVNQKLSDAEKTILIKRTEEEEYKTYIAKVQESVVEYQKRIKELESKVENLSEQVTINTPTVPDINQTDDKYVTRDEEKNNLVAAISRVKRQEINTSKKTVAIKSTSQRIANTAKLQQSPKTGANKWRS